MDCLHWVNRDSYLPQGSRGLKVGLLRLAKRAGTCAVVPWMPAVLLSLGFVNPAELSGQQD